MPVTGGGGRRFSRDPRGPQIRINHRIRVPEVRVVAEDGSNLGVLSTEQALRIAKRDTSNLRNMWDFMAHMRVTNKTSEQIVKESYGL